MKGDSKMVKDLERLNRQIRAGKKSLEESVKKMESLNASIRAEIQSRQHARNRRRNK